MSQMNCVACTVAALVESAGGFILTLDNTPLRTLLERMIDAPRLARAS